jgi:hypothetical protein
MSISPIAAWKAGIERGDLDAPAVAAKAVCDAPVVDVAAGDGFGIARQQQTYGSISHSYAAQAI